ncbi:exopolysaccharide biosynthesis polyprenyl glycosylphosphotransferase [Pseudonocardia benzenivorans]|uniref:Exopolysaccharide biosynthesis polyprenyl glycosylphosphotransferase n=1 Tax=Pseudonocardia dioxanivorans (strain ATCC 55486 / DSM 44775 / JCM 13855 / CB1190) TaxID=675635 RepID=F4CSP1_PSEUX|nr:exopolysaccharide biosynthesis polyprenyl glycosylphosphotransferase [Pseudonocardia dioxanivorans CB1190]GJF07451.1 UDP-phosphate galactose phosphotransferase [Pseudonocardia sp. D17]
MGRHARGGRAARNRFGLIVTGLEVGALVVAGGLSAWLLAPLPAAVVAVAVLLGVAASRRNAWRLGLSVLDDLPATALLVAVPTVLAEAVLVPTGLAHPLDALFTGAAVLVALVAARIVAFAIIRHRRKDGRDHLRALIVGSDEAGTRLGSSLDHGLQYGIRVVGFVDDDRPLLADLGPQLGSVDVLPQLVDEHRIDVVLVSFGAHRDDAVVDAVRELTGSNAEVFVVPRMFELHQRNKVSEMVDGIPLQRLRSITHPRGAWRVKRAIDVVVSAVALLMVSPVLAVIAAAVRKETGPGVIFKQERIGQHGVPFTLYKFRSLIPVGGEGDVRWNIDTDTRLGRVGKFIRATSLDELPQLVNVLKGDMSLVGPRPERGYFVERFNETIPGYRYRHRVPVGLTGYAAVQGLRGDTSIHQRAHFDNLYAESWSLWLDVKIAFWTISQLVPKRAPEAVLPVPSPPAEVPAPPAPMDDAPTAVIPRLPRPTQENAETEQPSSGSLEITHEITLPRD